MHAAVVCCGTRVPAIGPNGLPVALENSTVLVLLHPGTARRLACVYDNYSLLCACLCVSLLMPCTWLAGASSLGYSARACGCVALTLGFALECVLSPVLLFAAANTLCVPCKCWSCSTWLKRSCWARRLGVLMLAEQSSTWFVWSM